MDQEAKVLPSHEDREKRKNVVQVKWESATLEEKIEKLRIVLMDTPNPFVRISGLEQLLNQLLEHSHDGSGKIVVPLNRNIHGSGSTLGAISSAPLKSILE